MAAVEEDDLDYLPKPGCMMPVVWILFSGLVSLVGLGYLGFAVVNMGESESVGVAQAVAFPLGFAWTGAFIGLITHFVIKKASILRSVLPIGCGFFGGFGALSLMMLFFVVIWPSL